MATIGRKFAIADIRGHKLSGFIAWVFWLALHVFFLIGFRNRLSVMLQWAWAYFTYERGARLITMEGDARLVRELRAEPPSEPTPLPSPAPEPPREERETVGAGCKEVRW